ncbi:MAG: L,D-transpeptidase family protein [Alphaproteobacteria bacterium]
MVPAKWYPAKDRKDPIQVIVSLPEQKLFVYQGDKLLVTSRVSSGKTGYATPSGVFSILQKNRFHRSNIYSGAPMPFMQRLTWSGIALHGSNSVPKDRPASHGCIRLPQSFASQLFRFTQKGAHVIVANEKVEPANIISSNLFHPAPRAPKDYDLVEAEFTIKRSGIKVAEKKRSTSPVRILVTRRTGRERMIDVQEILNELSFGAGDVDGYMGPDTAQAIRRFQATYGLAVNGFVSDELIAMLYEVAEKGTPSNGHLYVRQDFNPVFDAPVVINGGDRPLGSHLFTAQYFEPGASKTRWRAITLKKGSPVNTFRKRSANKKKPVEGVVLASSEQMDATAHEALSRIDIPQEVRQRINKMLTPGSSLAITNEGISKETTPKGTDFVLLMQ